MLTTEIKKKIDSARDILVGKVPDPKAQVEQITNALIYKFMDDMDQEAIDLGGKPQFFNNGYEKYSWSKLMDPKLGGTERLDLYVDAVTKLARNPHISQLFRDIFKDAYLPYRDPETLSLFLKQINEFTYHHSEELGNSFEYLLSVLGSQGDAGQFRTPRHIIDFIVSVVDPKKSDRILDPACGTAGFLISAYKHILDSHDGKDENGKPNNETRLTPDERKRLANSIVGYDISPDMVKLSRVNMYLHGFLEPHIFEYDSLTNDDRWDDSFDVVLANPPFMTPKGGIRPHKRFSVQANRAEVLFVDYIAEHLTNTGRAGVIVPEGIVFQTGKAYKQLRKQLVENSLYAVVSLPQGVFLPYSNVKTSILFFDKKLNRASDNILFIQISNDGRRLSTNRAPQDGGQLDAALSVIKGYIANPRSDSTELSNEIDLIPSALARNLEGTFDEIGSPGSVEDLEFRLISKDTILDEQICDLSLATYTLDEKQVKTKWPTKRIAELVTFSKGAGIAKGDIVEDGEFSCIHYGELYTRYGAVIDECYSRTNLKPKKLSQKGDVLVPATTTADANGIAVASAINAEGVSIGGDINILRIKSKEILPEYLSYVLNFPLKNALASLARGTNIIHLSNKEIARIEVPLPPLEDQKEIIDKMNGVNVEIKKLKEAISSKNAEKSKIIESRL